MLVSPEVSGWMILLMKGLTSTVDVLALIYASLGINVSQRGDLGLMLSYSPLFLSTVDSPFPSS